MAVRYSINNRMAGSQQGLGSSYKTLVAMFATAGNLCRGELVDFTVGADGLPAATDCQVVYDISRMTVDGTGTAQAPNALDPVSAGALSTCKLNYTAEPTVTAASSVMSIALNQRASMRVFLDQGFRWPATAANGLVVRAISPSANYVNAALATCIFQE